MSREKQIEEMAQIIKKPCVEIFNEAGEVAQPSECPFPYECDECTAINLYKAGYRKQEWISVNERLPEPQKLVLCIWERGDDRRNYGFARYQRENVWYVSNEGMPRVTHWMPLPEPPKGE